MINDARYTREIKSRFAVAKVAFIKTTTTTITTTKNKRQRQQQQQDSFLYQTGLKEETSTMLHLEHNFFMVLNHAYFGKQIRNTRKVLKCGAGKGWRSV